eukprot:SAG11_NODE_5860_length_1446_cov_1.148478_2_plen_68_part_00
MLLIFARVFGAGYEASVDVRRTSVGVRRTGSFAGLYYATDRGTNILHAQLIFTALYHPANTNTRARH